MTRRTIQEIAREEVEWMSRDSQEPIHYVRIGGTTFTFDVYDDDGKALTEQLRRELERLLEEASG